MYIVSIIISGKHRRLTIVECNNDINSMIDVAKIADLVSLSLINCFDLVQGKQADS